MATGKWSGRAALLAVGIALAGDASAETVYVQKPTAVVREGKAASYKEVATVAKGGALTVLERDGRWLRVRAPGGEGWVFEGTVTAKKTGPGLGELLGSNADAEAAKPGAAGKGMEPEADAYADAKRLDRAPLERMVAAARAIDAEEWERFMQQGRVGDAKR